MSSVYPPFGGPPAQLCLRCGTPLPSHVVTCVNCGTYNPIAQPGTFSDQTQIQWGGLQSQTSFNGGQYSGTQLGQPNGSPSQYNQWGQLTTLPQNNVYGVPYAPHSSSPPSTSYGGYVQSHQRKSGPHVGIIVGIVLLVVLLAGGAFAGYFYYKNHFQITSATSTTHSVVATPTAVPLFSDSFDTNKMGWDLTSYLGKFSVKVGGGALVLEDDQNKLLWEIVPGKIFTDFRLDVDATLTKGDSNNGYGVLIRASNQGTDLGTYYRFELYGDGTYAIFKGYLDATGTTQSMNVHGYVAKPAIAKVGQLNHITIVAKGPAMSLMVNGQTVYTYTDTTYKGGSIAVFVSNLPELPPGARATFTHLAIFPLPK